MFPNRKHRFLFLLPEVVFIEFPAHRCSIYGNALNSGSIP